MKRGFTFVELIVVGGITATLLGLMIVNLNSLQTRTSTGVLTTQLTADLRGQQLLAMNTALGAASTNAGIHFTNNSYVLFTGSAFSASDPTNFTVTLPTPWEITSSFVNSQIVFSAGSGEVVGLSSGQYQVSIYRNDSQDSKTIYINRYGAYDEE